MSDAEDRLHIKNLRQRAKQMREAAANLDREADAFETKLMVAEWRAAAPGASDAAEEGGE